VDTNELWNRAIRALVTALGPDDAAAFLQSLTGKAPDLSAYYAARSPLARPIQQPQDDTYSTAQTAPFAPSLPVPPPQPSQQLQLFHERVEPDIAQPEL
jgi:hypothetical protein